MTAFVHPQFTSQHVGALRAASIAQGVQQFVAKAFNSLSQRVLQHVEHSRSAAEDHKLWEMALADARLMADISRAMKEGAPNKVAFY